MKVLDPGHRYLVHNLDAKQDVDKTQTIQFVKRAIVPGRTEEYPGTNCQELIRVLIDRVRVLNGEKQWEGNNLIVGHLQECLLLFEILALQRKLEKGTLKPESIRWSLEDGHFILYEGQAAQQNTHTNDSPL